MRVFGLKSNRFCLWKGVVNILISIYVWFSWLRMCVVCILMVVVFLTYSICIIVAICWSFNHLKGFRRMFSSFIEIFCANSQQYHYQLYCYRDLLLSWLIFFVVRSQCFCFCFCLVISCFEIGVTIYIDPFFNLDFFTSYILIFHIIINPFMECKHDNVTYILCILSQTLLSDWQRPMIKWSNFCPCVLKFIK
jgi:hypothetical protein